MSEPGRPEGDGREQRRPEGGGPEQGGPEQGGPEEQDRPGQVLAEHGRSERGLDEHGLAEHGERPEPAAGAGVERARLEDEFLLALRRAGSIMQLLGQLSAERIGVNATDLNCLNLVALTGYRTAGDLAKETGLTTASITGVLDRLEEGGFVRRERDPHDRRRVIVNLSAGPGLHQVGATFAPLVRAWRDTAAGYSDDELHLLLEFQRRIEEVMRGQLARLRSESAAAQPRA